SSTEGEVSPASVQSSQERSNQDGSSSSRSKVVDPVAPPSRPKTENPTNNKGKEIRSNTFDMPCVFTQGDGPSGRRIEGILYKYGKGEEVKIMCVCHGSFLSPAEFVMHAGGTDVVHPLKHIVVNPNSSTYL
ncbi:ninja-family protein AFP1, partial [Tanacetum coccineum]